MTPFVDSFVFGAANSLHCAAMCGPLAVVFGPSAGATLAYQGSRAMAYALLGGGLGAAGTLFGTDRIAAPTAAVAFTLALGLTVLALGGERGAIRIPGLQRALARVQAAGRGLRPMPRAALLGLCTPLLPCGLLWSACTGAVVAGSTLAGAWVMAGFALGSLPALLLAQRLLPTLLRRFSPRAVAQTRRGVMLLAAALLVWRGIAAWDGGCCH